jgi:hypothetical protein
MGSWLGFRGNFHHSLLKPLSMVSSFIACVCSIHGAALCFAIEQATWRKLPE